MPESHTTRPSAESLPLSLHTLAGPQAGPFVLPAGEPATVGRLVESTVCLLNDRVSRRHALLTHKRNGWFILDQHSKEGTFVNGVAVSAESPTPIGPGDLLRIGPWTFRVGLGGGAQPRSAATIDDRRAARVDRYRESGATLASRRLSLLTDCIARLAKHTEETAVAQAVLASALQACGYSRGAVLRPSDLEGHVSVITSEGFGDQTASPSFSRSLVNAAAEGNVAGLADLETRSSTGQSIADLGIHAAICAPIHLGDAVAAFLYLDARGDEPALQPDSPAFCEALARACGLALANLKRAELDARQREMAAELTAAREAQQFIMPPIRGTVGPVQYAMRMAPGMYVAGDLFDVVPLPDGRVAVVIGDVAGHGAGSAMIMAGAQAHLHAVLTSTGDAAMAVSSLNRYLSGRETGGRFASLWLGVIGPGGMVDCVDAGHGHWFVRSAAGAPRAGGAAKSIPVGIDAEALYPVTRFALEAGERIIVYSDGAIEERNARAEFFGRERLIRALAASSSAADDVERIFEAIRHFTGVTTLDDDVTIASICPA
ncbi:MAG: SpoIIE family protein phosphatase [Phycisphaerales bacterium]